MRFKDHLKSSASLMALLAGDIFAEDDSGRLCHMAGGFQTQVNVQPAPAVEGDFCDANPRYTVDAGPGGLVAGASGVTVGRFAWTSVSSIDPDNAPTIVNNFGVGPVAGFVHREQQALITQYLAGASMLVPQGYQVTLHSGGGFWVKNKGSGYAQPNMKAYANFVDGSVSFAAAGAPPTAVVTGSVAASTFAVTGSITGNVMTVTNVTSGTVVPGATISGTGVASGTQVVSQLSGTPGGNGTYAVSIAEQAAASTTINGTYGTMTVTGVTSGALVVGGTISGTNVVAGTQITAFGTGAGGNGTYIVNNNTVVASTTITEATAVETKWIAMSGGASGELVKISDKPLG